MLNTHAPPIISNFKLRWLLFFHITSVIIIAWKQKKRGFFLYIYSWLCSWPTCHFSAALKLWLLTAERPKSRRMCSLWRRQGWELQGGLGILSSVEQFNPWKKWAWHIKHYDTDTFPLINNKTTLNVCTFFQRQERADLFNVASYTLLKDSEFLSIKLTIIVHCSCFVSQLSGLNRKVFLGGDESGMWMERWI